MSSAETISSVEPTITPIRRLLIANRGEIARRIQQTAHAMGIETVAVFADGDADAPFVRHADHAVALGGESATETYLDVAKLLRAAERSRADAVHPGYGFLAENAPFAQAVIDAGLVWVGPPPDAIAAMGDKLAAKQLMDRAQVPTLPSVELTASTDEMAAAHEIGFPVLIKASAGGGGKGMRVVAEPDDLAAAIAGAKREAASSFGDDTVFVEKYLAAPRHIEVQVLGDQHGALVHLFERECSIQRRHQKIIEEAPSTAVDDELRAAMGEAALRAVRAIDYSSAGTVEFLLDGTRFWFLEVNTRIQVEHPVTEEITGIDLIREQLRVATGERLGYGQADVTRTGHAIEARLYAEDPTNDFLPAVGTLHAFETPASPPARVDTGVETGSVVGVHFDPMLAKVIVHAPTRAEAAQRLALVLAKMTVTGVVTNRDFLVAALRSPEFLVGDTTTDFVERVDLPRMSQVLPEDLAAAATAAALFELHRAHAERSALGFMRIGFRNSSMPPERLSYEHQGRVLDIEITFDRSGDAEVTVNDEDGHGVDLRCRSTRMDIPAGTVGYDHEGLRRRFRIVQAGSRVHVAGPGAAVDLDRRSRFPDHSRVEVTGGQVAPMPGRISTVLVTQGQTVEAADQLVIMEAMKMEHTITAPAAGSVLEVRCTEGDQVDSGQTLVVLDFDDDTAE